MTGRASGLITEKLLAPLSGGLVERPRWRLRCAQSELIFEQRRAFRRNEIGRLGDEQSDAPIAEVAMSAHLSDADVAVPIGDRSVAGDGLEADAFEPVDRRNHNRQRPAVQRNQIGAVEGMMT